MFRILAAFSGMGLRQSSASESSASRNTLRLGSYFGLKLTAGFSGYQARTTNLFGSCAGTRSAQEKNVNKIKQALHARRITSICRHPPPEKCNDRRANP